MNLAYWPPLILLIIGGAFFLNGMIVDEQPSHSIPTTTSPQQEVPAKKERVTDQEQPSLIQQKLPANAKTEAEVYKLF